MKHKVSELEGALLDAAVATAEGLTVEVLERGPFCDYSGPCVRLPHGPREIGPLPETHRQPLYELSRYSPSTSWLWGGPIIERERIEVVPCPSALSGWQAWAIPAGETRRAYIEGATPLVAVMRAFVASKLGEEVEL